MKILLRISASAAEFFVKMVRDEPAEMVLVITGLVLGTSGSLDDTNWEGRPIGDLVDAGRRLFNSIPANPSVKYVIGTKELDRVPRDDVHLINGIKCYIPKHLIPLIGDREIVLKGGELHFEPELPPVVVTKPSA